MTYKIIQLVTPQEHTDIIADLFTANDALSVSLEEYDNQELFQINPDERPLWQKTLVKALFPADADIKTIMQNVEAFSPIKPLDYQTLDIEDQDWVRITQENFPAMSFNNKLSIAPSWCKDDDLPGKKVLLDPGLAFGTGTHPTTKLCLEWLAEHPPENINVIDYGCGSGILSLASLALGAKKVYAVDHDPQAVISTKNNMNLNQFDENGIEVFLPDALPNITAPLIIANILANPLKQLAPTFAKLCEPGGNLILSGILPAEADEVCDVYREWFEIIDVKELDNWVRIHLKRREL